MEENRDDTDDILDSLEDLGYSGPEVTSEVLQKAIEGGPKSVEYTQIIEWLSKELKVLCKLDDDVNAISTPDDSSSFVMEVSSFLKEMHCPYKSLVEGPLTQRLLTKQSRFQLLDFLCTELQAARMIAHSKPEIISSSMKVEVDESQTAASLKNMLVALQFPKPPANITPNQLFTKIDNKAKDILSKMSPKAISKPVFTGQLSDKQWHTLESINESFQKDYKLRRTMLIKRLDVTIQSFKWSSRAKNREDDIAKVFSPIRQMMSNEVNVCVADVLAARESIAIVEKTSCASVRKNTQSAINKVMIGKVPDRGGRPNEQRPPPPEMPSWQKRTDSSSGGGGRGGRGGGNDRGSRVQGGWSGGGKQENSQHGGGGWGGGKDAYQGYQGGGHQSGGYQGGGHQGGGYQGGYQGTGGYQSGGYQGTGYQGGGGGGGGGYQGGGYQRGGGGGYNDDGSRGRGRGRGGGRGGRGRGGGGGYRGNGNVDTNAAHYHQNQGSHYSANVDYSHSGY